MNDTLLSILECPICLETFNTPYNLICGHSICKDCIYKLIKINNIVCPLCNNESTNIINNNIISLSKNYSLIQILNYNNNNNNIVQSENNILEKQQYTYEKYISKKKIHPAPSCFLCCITNSSRNESSSDSD